MSLVSEVHEQFKLLLDKPVSAASTKQILALIKKQVLPTETLISALLYKNRADLLYFLIEKQPITPAAAENILRCIRKDILKYTEVQAEQIWALLLRKAEFTALRTDWGLFNLLTEALRVPNEGSKQRILWLITSNFQVIHQLQEFKALASFVVTFIPNYLKYNIYLAPFPAIATQCLQFAAQTPASLIESSTLGSLLQRTLDLLESTTSKHLYPFQKQCLKLITEILQSKDLGIDMMLTHSCKRIVSIFLLVRPVRQEARGANQALEALQAENDRRQRQKMSLQPAQKSDNLQNPPILIENIIQRVNQYRHRQNLYLCSPSSNGLVFKKGTSLYKSKVEKRDLSSSKYNSKKTAEIEAVIQKCLKAREDQKLVQSIRGQAPHPADVWAEQDLGTEWMSTAKQNQSIALSSADDFDEFAEVSSLIDLAYQYKFG